MSLRSVVVPDHEPKLAKNMQIKNLFEDGEKLAEGEVCEELLRNVVIERIHSSERVPPRLYEQPQDEWVMLLRGSARLAIGTEVLELRAGDTVFIPARAAHRVLRTSRDPQCVWLAVHIH